MAASSSFPPLSLPLFHSHWIAMPKLEEEEDAAPISSFTRSKRKAEGIYLSPARKRVSGGKAREDRDTLFVDLECQPPQEERYSLMETIFSPVLHLFKGIGGECFSSSSSTATTVVIEAARSNHDDKARELLRDFDPYLFIKHLPDPSLVLSPCRKFLLPRRTRRCPPVALVLDLDETLVHSTTDHCGNADFSFSLHANFQRQTVYVRRRPHLQMFMERVAQLFEIIVFTASQSTYAEKLLNILDPKRKVFRHRIFRDSCVLVDGNYLKDLSVLGRDLSKTVIVDNSPQAFGFQVDNGIPIESWFDDEADCALASLLPFLESLASAEDVRPIIASTYKLRQKIQAASDPPWLRHCVHENEKQAQ
ncbi:CTD small phosphatase-like protein 2 [Selaginella moellendorffii]|nr:CTD small phosphatase-like protein 2 [Selaginella moellendorffii]|eukprot:XP_002987345.2 CTD small phosphatase-like protein 2 [Selaginella moellendorffii]